MKKTVSLMLWCAVILLGVWSYFVLATRRAEPINAGTLLAAALCTYAIGYRFYSKWITARILTLNDRRATPCEVHEDGKDFVRTNKWIVFGHHFAAISGPGPLVGPVLAAQFGYLPGTLWILIGVVLGGAVQDFVILVASMRRDGRSLAQMVREEINSFAGLIGLIAILAIMIILLAVLALVVVNALAESPWGVFTVGATIPIALFMGGYLRFWRVGKVLEVSVIGVVLLLFAVWGGQFVHATPSLSQALTFRAETLAWIIIAYGFAASVLPVWLLLAPRDYLSTFMKLGTIAALALGTLLVLPDLHMPAISRFVDGSGLVVPGSVFPFCFITIACGAISGFHTLISSGITPKIITRESHARSVGYGAMLLESLVAIMAMIAACTLDPGVYLAMNIRGSGPTQEAVEADIISRIDRTGFTAFRPDPASPALLREQPVAVSAEEMRRLADEVGEKTLFGRTGGAATLAVGMAQIFGRLTQGRWIDLWYHFAVMFEALFILTTLDAGTRVGRYLVQDAIRRISPRLGNLQSWTPNVLASGLIVAGWGAFLIIGVRDPQGGIRALWPIFGIANQLLASIALCLATTLLLKSQLNPQATPVSPQDHSSAPGIPSPSSSPPRRPLLALVTLVPLAWLLTVTLTAGVQKVFHADPRIGFLAGLRAADQQRPSLEAQVDSAQSLGDAPALASAQAALRNNRITAFGNRLDAIVTLFFLALVALMVALSAREWFLLLARRKPAVLHETTPVWLPDYAITPSPSSLNAFSLGAMLLTLLREITGQADFDRARSLAHHAASCEGAPHPDHLRHLTPCPMASPHLTPGTDLNHASSHDQQLWVRTLDDRYRSVRRCC